MAVENDSKPVQDVNSSGMKGFCAAYLRIQEQINRIEGLKHYEYDTLLFILDRTVRFGKTRERVSVNHLQKGVYRRGTGELIRRGVGQNRNNTIATLRKLVDLGYLVRDESGPNTAPMYGLSLQRFDFSGMVGVSDEILAGVSRQILVGGISSDTLKGKEDLKREKRTKRLPGVTAGVVETLNPTEGEVVVNLQERIDQAKDRNRAKRAHKAQSLAINFTISNLNALWADLMLQHFPDSRFPGRFTVDMFHRLKAGLKAQGLLDNSDDAIELIRYSVENWTYLYTFCNWDRIGLFSAQPSPMAIASGIKILVEGRNRNEASARYHSADTAQTRIAAQDRKFKERQQYVAAKKQYEAPDPMGDDEDDDGFFAKRFNRELDNLWAAR